MRDLSHLEYDVLFLVKQLQSSLKKSLSLQEKHSDPTGYQRMSWRILRVAIITGGSFC